MDLTFKDSIHTTVSYADVFDYPLTQEQLRVWLVGKRVPNSKNITYPSDIKIITYNQQTYVQFHKNRFIQQRVSREVWAKEKWKRVGGVVKFLRMIPTIQLIGVTGGLAMNNARERDDIDLFFIVSDKTMWVSRMLITGAIELLGLRRKPNQQNVKNKICLNMYMSEQALSLPKREQDLFLAHEVLQMKPVFDRGVYKKFLQSNRWVKKFLPNAWDQKIRNPASLASIRRSGPAGRSKFEIRNNKSGTLKNMVIGMLKKFEPLAKVIQLRYMEKRRTTEVVSDTVLRFHPFDARAYVKEKLSKRLARYNVPLDNVFYDR